MRFTLMGISLCPIYSSGASGESIPYEVAEIENSNVSFNLADGFGGGMYIKDIGTVLDTVTVQGNVADYGGGIYQREASTVLLGSVEDNLQMWVQQSVCMTMMEQPIY